ncbi:hypothetical protein BT96DRAFT_915514 [Gymnopus androsaceus JB14]|uniref:2'-phosphotransferase n=1 Tax=Gymnopus androsaceus JB14 TaxID=1447944 RepID=A0A6A4IAE9_9AGAR|nr:hypothetical protein BT96DRAFT_915514 [Gymnopus androsaceus JB14]
MTIKRRLAPKPLKDENFVAYTALKKFGPRLAWILRHNAPSLGIYIKPDGYALAEDVLKIGIFKRMPLSNLKALCKLDTVSRIEWKEREPNEWWVRATGQHTIKFIDPSRKEIVDARKLKKIVYVAELDEWDRIQKQGIRPAEDEHLIKLSKAIPDPIEYSLSGRESSSLIVIHIDIEKSMQNGLGFYVTLNETDGIVTDGGVDGFIPSTLFRKVERLEWSSHALGSESTKS